MQHLWNVYLYLAMCIIVITIGSSICKYFDIFLNNTAAIIASVTFFLILELKPNHYINKPGRICFLFGFAASMGFLIGPYMKALVKNTPDILPTSIIVTTLIFASLTFCSMTTEMDHWLYLKGPLFALLSFLVYLDIGAILFGGAFLLDQIDLYIGLPVLSGYVLYDTQFINKEVFHGNTDDILHSITLLIDLIGIFARVLKIMSQWRTSLGKYVK